MRQINRRTLLKHAVRGGLGLAAGSAALVAAPSVRGAPAAEKVRLACVGLHGRGYVLTEGFAQRPDVDIAYLCDVNSELLPARVKLIEKHSGRSPKTVQDLRRVLDDKSVDGVVIATPDHWHVLAAIWACQAGKHVYVEKPVTYSPWEGWRLIEAARKYNRVVQAGTQNRSAPYNFAAREYIQSGKLGEIHLCRVFNQKARPNRKRLPDEPPPAALDWDMWLGPAQKRPYNRNCERGWQAYWEFSGGDMANDGVHQMDLARWLLGVEHARSVYSVGHRYYDDGIEETPATQVSTWEFDGLVVTFEMTLYTPYMLKSDDGVRNGDLYPYWPQNAERIEIYGSEGVMYVGRMGAGWQVYERPKDRKPVLKAQLHGKFPDPEHREDFISCVRSGRRPNADIEKVHRSELLIHYANISYRLGGVRLVVDPKAERLVDNAQANAMLRRREYRKPWVIPEAV